jgi:hypothetical protein
MSELALHSVHQELEEPLSAQHYGGAAAVSGLIGRIADRPVGFRVRDVFKGLGKDVPPEVDLYKRFELWLVPNRVSVMRERGAAEVVSVGLECEFAAHDRTLCVVELLPGPAFIVHGGVHGSFECAGEISPSGAVSPAPALNTVDAANLAVLQRQGVQFKTGATLGVQASFRFSVATPYVHAVGVGSSRAQWRFDRHEDPLFGRDVEMWCVVALPKDVSELNYRARMFITVRTAFFPTRQQSTWEEMTCILEP